MSITTVNFHLIKACNYKCKFCYATFNDIDIANTIRQEEAFAIITKLADSKLFKKINFAGGEPTLIKYIVPLIKHAKDKGFETSIVTNGSQINLDWIKSVANSLDILTLSIDSINEETNIKSGRHQNGKILELSKIFDLAVICKELDIKLKVNTAVHQYNFTEILAPFINELNPFRWKILQVTRVIGQNDKQFELMNISNADFDDYCARNKGYISPKIKIIAESADIISGSYLMIDPLGRFFDSNNKTYNYSIPILKTGVENALSQINTDYSKFLNREGNYTTI